MYLGIVKTESGSPRLSRDLIRGCNITMRLLDSSVGAFAITSTLVNAFHSVSFLHFRYGN